MNQAREENLTTKVPIVDDEKELCRTITDRLRSTAVSKTSRSSENYTTDSEKHGLLLAPGVLRLVPLRPRTQPRSVRQYDSTTTEAS